MGYFVMLIYNLLHKLLGILGGLTMANCWIWWWFNSWFHVPEWGKSMKLYRCHSDLAETSIRTIIGRFDQRLQQILLSKLTSATKKGHRSNKIWRGQHQRDVPQTKRYGFHLVAPSNMSNMKIESQKSSRNSAHSRPSLGPWGPQAVPGVEAGPKSKSICKLDDILVCVS